MPLPSPTKSRHNRPGITRSFSLPKVEHPDTHALKKGSQSMPISRWFLSPLPAIVVVAAFAIYQFTMRSTTLLPILTGLLSLTLTRADDSLNPLTIYAYGINATFIGYGARLTSLFVHDKNNDPRVWLRLACS